MISTRFGPFSWMGLKSNASILWRPRPLIGGDFLRIREIRPRDKVKKKDGGGVRRFLLELNNLKSSLCSEGMSLILAVL